MIAKIVFIASSYDIVSSVIEKHSIDGGYWLTAIDDGRLIVVAYPRHHSTRFSLADEEGVIVMPGPHDPNPIGDLHEHLLHIDARPHHTPREVHLRLHEQHGAAWHPDTWSMYPYNGVYDILADSGNGAPIIYVSPSSPSFAATQGSFCITASGTAYINNNGSTGWTQLASGSGAVTSVTATAPLTSSGGAVPNIALTSPLSVAKGGTGTTTPALVGGTGISVTGSWPGQTISALSNVNLGFFSPAAQCQSSHDDLATINAAIAAASGVGGTVWISQGATSTCYISGVINVPLNVQLWCPEVTLAPFGSYVGSAVSFNGGGGAPNLNRHILGSVNGFTSGSALYFPGGTAYSIVEAMNLMNNKTGVEFNDTTGGGCFGHMVRFNYCGASTPTGTTGVLYNQSLGASSTIQSCEVYAGSINTLGSGITFLSTSSAVSGGGMSANYCDVGCINGNVAGTTGITYSNCSPTSMNFIRVRNSFGAFQTNKFITLTSAQPERQAFELAVAAGGTTLTGSGGYNTFNLYPGGAGKNTLRVLGGNVFSSSEVGGIGGAFTAVSTANTRSSFNSGNAQFFQRFFANCTITSLAAGGQVAFYVYSPYTNGNINGVRGGIMQMSGGLQNLILLELYDNSTVNANEIRIAIGNPTAGTISTTLQVWIEVGGF
jgi:hypothetical protein